jgi:hypothetical protein
VSAADEFKPPYAQRLEDELNELHSATGNSRLEFGYVGVAVQACSELLSGISDGTLPEPVGEDTHVIPVDLITGSGPGFIGDGGVARFKSSFGVVQGALAVSTDVVVLTIRTDEELISAYMHRDEVSRVGAIKLRSMLVGIPGVEFLHRGRETEESMGRLVLLVPIEAPRPLDRTWQHRLVAGLRQG